MIYLKAFNCLKRNPSVTEAIHSTRYLLKQKLHRFISRSAINLLVVENALSIPMNIPLGLAITEMISETGLPTIAHHHDFYWERTRYASNAAGEYLRMAFPPDLPSIEHVVINTAARRALAHRVGVSAEVIPNVIEFERPPQIDSAAAARTKAALGLKPEDKIILQPTRIVRRKGIEIAIDLVRSLQNPNCKLMISHEGGDEGDDYEGWLRDYARANRVDMRIIGTEVESPWAGASGGQEKINLWDVYSIADTRTLARAAQAAGLKVKIHADEFSSLGGAQLAAEVGAISAEHLVNISKEGIQKIAQSPTAAILLPGVPFFLMMDKHAPARQLIDQGAIVAIASDFNPGSSMTENMLFILQLAVLTMGLSIEEAIQAATVNAAYAVSRDGEIGSLEIGKKMDLILCDIPNYYHLVYHLGINPVKHVIKDGRAVVKEGQVLKHKQIYNPSFSL